MLGSIFPMFGESFGEKCSTIMIFLKYRDKFYGIKVISNTLRNKLWKNGIPIHSLIFGEIIGLPNMGKGQGRVEWIFIGFLTKFIFRDK